MHLSVLLTAPEVLKLPEAAQTAYLACIWVAACVGAITAGQYVAVMIAAVLFDDLLEHSAELPRALRIIFLVQDAAAVWVLRHVANNLLPEHLACCKE